jgi:polysaccharide deacetylase family protein (PEP-CTERM system associated)
MMALLELLGERGVRATMFILGCVAEAHPDLVRELAAAGHEIASHGWDHRRVTEQTPEEFRGSVRRTKIFLEDLTGAPVLGFRAPSFSIVPGGEWALDILVEEGYLYDSSLFPVRRRGYGYPGGQRDPHWLERPVGRLAEVPPATLRRWGGNFPAAGGGYLRLLPPWLFRSAFLDAERRGVPATFYIHPWELDPDQPRLAVSWPTRLRHYGGLQGCASRVRHLLHEFSFQPIAATLHALQVR